MEFFRKKLPPMNSREYETLAKRITDIEINMDKLVSKFMSLRGLIHRKKLDEGLEEIETSDLEKAENIKGNVLLPDPKGINKD